MSENLAEFYYNELGTTKTPSKVLRRMMYALLEIPEDCSARTLAIDINRLLKVYGKYNIYWCILDLIDFKNIDWSRSVYPLMSTVIKRKLHESRINPENSYPEDMSPYVKSINRKVKKLSGRKLDMENPFNDE